MNEFAEAACTLAQVEVEAAQPNSGKEQMVCYTVAYLSQIECDGLSMYLCSKSEVCATRELAEWWLPQKQAETPSARIVPIVLEFDLDVEAELNAFLEMQCRINWERALLAEARGAVQ